MSPRVLKTNIENAIESLHANRLRTFLTMLGVMIGIASVVVIFSLSGGVGSMISNQIVAEGGALAVVRPKELTANDKNVITSLATSKSFTQSSITNEDLGMISKIKEVSAVAPLANFSAKVRGDGEEKYANLLATSPNLDQTVSLKVREGQFIADSANANTVVLGNQMAIDLFGTTQAVGKEIAMKGEKFIVIGVLTHQSSSINFSNVDFNNTAIIPYETAKRIIGDNLQIQQVNIHAKSINSLGAIQKQIESDLLKKHNGERDFEVLTGKNISHPSDKFIELSTLILAIVASVSLVVGGIGIMNIMLVNVSERTREIGIRKALGANNRHILFQFLTESMIISLGGGLFGYLIGYAFSFGVSMFLPFSPIISWQIALLVCGLSTVVGVIFGLYPAFRAARKDPIVSLRQYS
ncbi:MAG: ABC transporter permease [Candidatus Nanogingivalaceae bacterium]|jgi:ABC superfamily ATP binding cassette transporter, membrane protein|nr:ABC transporter permease [Candidatus Nanogingivalaceae bacterium]QTI96321.1 MAG: ABC transporter permease [Candidatus Nanogingivalaceae bacterium]QWB91633.1 MAG: ABC transporter permease [Candidatus Nanogingivalaceae bacterium]